MIKKTPIAAHPISLREVFFSRKDAYAKLTEELRSYLGVKYVYLYNSGTAACYLALEAFKKISEKKEVILPAYTASTLVLAIERAGLTPVLCDISLEDFNLDISSVAKKVSANTLAFIGVHMFGIAQQGLKEFSEQFPEVFVLEDCCQAMGTAIYGEPVGNGGDVSIFSFNRGKNISSYSGGCIATDNALLAERIEEAAAEFQSGDICESSFSFRMKLVSLSLLVNPLFYGLFYNFLSFFKHTPQVLSFSIAAYCDLQASVALSGLADISSLSEKRYKNGISLINKLQAGKNGVRLPKIAAHILPAFNRVPILIEDSAIIPTVQKRLWEMGIESSRFYEKCLHQFFSLPGQVSGFPNAEYLAEHILTLPSHSFVSEMCIDKISMLIEDIL